MTEAELIKQRSTIKAAATRIKSFVATFDISTHDINLLHARHIKLDELWSKYDVIQTQLEAINDKQEEDRDTFEDIYYSVKATIHKFVSTSTSQAISQISSVSSNNDQIKLPEIQIPTFYGKYEDWKNFHDIFTSIIHDNKKIPDVQKLFYLKGAVKGEAALVINSLSPTPNNYEVAWDLLRERFDNKEFIVNSHLKAMFQMPNQSESNAVNLRELINTSKQNLRALKALNLKTEECDAIIIYLLSSKLDTATRQSWQMQKRKNQLPTLEAFHSFLEQKCTALELYSTENNNAHTSNQANKTNAKTSPKQSNTQQSCTKSQAYVSNNQQLACPMCKQSHQIFSCQKFLNLTPEKRCEEAKRLKLCYNCLRSSHFTQQCKSGTCRKCNKHHNSLLHIEQPQNKAGSQQKEATVTMHQATHVSYPCTNTILLSTAVVKIINDQGKESFARLMLDSGSQSNFITKEFCNSLGIAKQKTNVNITGIGTGKTVVNERTRITIHSRTNPYKATLDFLVVPRITNNLPAISLNSDILNSIPNDIELADSDFHKSLSIDMLIGAELFFELLCIGQIRTSNNSPTYQKTKLGWIVSGKLKSQVATHLTCNLSTQDKLYQQIEKFWTIEEVTSNKSQVVQSEELDCERHFVQGTIRQNNGRFEVRLPFNEQLDRLGESETIAMNEQQYRNFMSEYEQLGHMQRLAVVPKKHYYLPHHAVIKKENLTTKIRVVFDGSAKTTTNISLNDTLMKGPIIQDELVQILIRFRIHNVVITADVMKMYRQIQVNSEDANYQLIFWRNPGEDIRTYKLTTVTYGTKSAPFLAVRCLKQLAIDAQSTFPEASSKILSDCYVDDLITGTNSVAEAQTLIREITQIMQGGQFQLRKWRTNQTQLLSQVDESKDKLLTIDKIDPIKTLGLLWNSKTDEFQFTYSDLTCSPKITKRIILSIIAQIYDPLGLIGPIVVIAKLIMQKLWAARISWDESVSLEIYTSWKNYVDQIQQLSSIRIPRQVVCQNYTHIQLQCLFGRITVSIRNLCLSTHYRHQWSSCLQTSHVKITGSTTENHFYS